MNDRRSRLRAGKAIYRNFEVKLWSDPVFRSLSRPKPNAQTLLIWLITGHTTIIVPGIVVGRFQVHAAHLEWSLRAFRKALSELAAKHLVVFDEDAGVILLPSVLTGSSPQSPNAAKSWAKAVDGIPNCPIKERIRSRVESLVEAMGDAFWKAYLEAWPSLEDSLSYPESDSEEETEPDSDRERERAGGHQPFD